MIPTINLLMHDSFSHEIWKSLLEDLLGKCNFNLLYFENQETISSKILDTNLWIIEVWDIGYLIPDGYTIGKKLLQEDKSVLLVYNLKPFDDFPDEGYCWITYFFNGNLKDKINSILNKKIIDLNEKKYLFEKMKKFEKYYKPKIHSHHHH